MSIQPTPSTADTVATSDSSPQSPCCPGSGRRTEQIAISYSGEGESFYFYFLVSKRGEMVWTGTVHVLEGTETATREVLGSFGQHQGFSSVMIFTQAKLRYGSAAVTYCGSSRSPRWFYRSITCRKKIRHSLLTETSRYASASCKM